MGKPLMDILENESDDNICIDARYIKHLIDRDKFVIQGLFAKDKSYIQIHIKPDEAIELLGALQIYLFNNIRFIGDDE